MHIVNNLVQVAGLVVQALYLFGVAASGIQGFGRRVARCLVNSAPATPA